MQALPGSTMRQVLDDPAAPVPDAAALNALLAALPDPAAGAITRSPVQQVGRLGQLLAALLPEHAQRIGQIVSGIGTEAVPATVPCHGDFYEAQLLVAHGSVVGMLDVDTFGWGRPGDDLATMLGHLDVRRAGGHHAQRIGEYAGTLLRTWDRVVDPADLRRRVAAVVLGLATGPFRVQRAEWPTATAHRIEMAQRWVDSVRRVDEKRLINTSASSHAHRAR